MSLVFGPLLSRRFGLSLGVDLSPAYKQCNFNCVYCELKASSPIDSQEIVIPPSQVLSAIESALNLHKNLEVLTFTANGEPTLYPHLEEVILGAKSLVKPHPGLKTLILSNGSRFGECKEALMHFDLVKFSLDSLDPVVFKRVDKPSKSLSLSAMKAGLMDFAKDYRGELIAEILVVARINDEAHLHRQSADFLKTLGIKRLDISTIDRPSSHRVFPVSMSKLYEIAEVFDGLPVCVVTRQDAQKDIEKRNLDSKAILETLRRRPLSRLDCETLWDEASGQLVENLVKEGEVVIRRVAGLDFYYANS